MRELGALMNSVAGVNPNDDVAVLTETLKCVRTLNSRISAFPPTANARTASQPKPTKNRCDPLPRPQAVHASSRCLTIPSILRRRATNSTSLREVKLQRDIPRGQIPRRRVSCVTKEPIPTEKLDVLEQNFRRHHYVSPEVSPPRPPRPSAKARTPHPSRLLTACGCDPYSCGPRWRSSSTCPHKRCVPPLPNVSLLRHFTRAIYRTYVLCSLVR